MSTLELRTSIQHHNVIRSASNQEYVGGLYFLFALGMLQYTFGVALIQAYVLPLRRFAGCTQALTNPKFASAIYGLFLAGLYFLISATGGLTGFIVCSGLLMLWAIVLIIIGIVRRILRRRAEKADIEAAENPEAVPDDNGIIKERAGDATINTQVRREVRDKNPWASSPAAMAPWQLACVFINTFLLLLTLVTILIIVYAWQIPDYQLATRDETATSEMQPALAAKTLQLMYAFPELATGFKLDIYVRLFSEYCGTKYRTNLTSDSAKYSDIQVAWVVAYGVNMSEAVPSSVYNYSSVNSWFIRNIDMRVRPLPTLPNAITSPADCRMTIFESITQSKNWFKGYELSYVDLTNGVIVNGASNYFENGGMVIARLAPTDYHRFHAPVSGTIVSMQWVPGTLWSVSSDAVGSGNNVMLNQRWVVIIDAGTTIGYVAYVAIGATCVGSVLMQADDGTPFAVGDFVQQGDQMGIMQFGGSTVIILFSSQIIVFDAQIQARSAYPIETLVQVNQQIGTARS